MFFQILSITIKCQRQICQRYVKDRYIGETVRSIYDIIDFTDRENISGLLIFIDFQKAFDTLEWDFLFKCLECFNFGHDFIHWVKVFLPKY